MIWNVSYDIVCFDILLCCLWGTIRYISLMSHFFKLAQVSI